MKTCLCCGNADDRDPATCAYCGEASWKVSEQEPQIAEPPMLDLEPKPRKRRGR